MGAGQSAAAHVVLDKHAWSQEEVITGVVVFNTNKPVPFHSVMLKLVGKERTHWEVQGQKSKTTYNGKHYILKAQVPLLAGPGTLGVGGHKMPFAISLPPGLPASFSFKQGSTKASIAYKVKVMIDQAGVFAKDFKASSEVHLLPRPPRVPAPVHLEEEGQVTCYCCCKRGAVALRIDSPVDVYDAGDKIPLTAKVDNCSSETVDCQGSLVCVVRLKCPGALGDSHWRHEAVVAEEALRREQGPAVGAASWHQQAVAVGAGAGGKGHRGSGGEQLVGLGPNQAGAFGATLHLEPDVMASVTDAHIISAWHELRVSASPPGCCLSGVRVSQPVLVCRSPAQLHQAAHQGGRAAAPAPPPGWAPRDYGAAGFAVGRDGSAREMSAGELRAAAALAAAVAPPGALPAAGAGEAGHWGPSSAAVASSGYSANEAAAAAASPDAAGWLLGAGVQGGGMAPAAASWPPEGPGAGWPDGAGVSLPGGMDGGMGRGSYPTIDDPTRGGGGAPTLSAPQEFVPMGMAAPGPPLAGRPPYMGVPFAAGPPPPREPGW